MLEMNLSCCSKVILVVVGVGRKSSSGKGYELSSGEIVDFDAGEESRFREGTGVMRLSDSKGSGSGAVFGECSGELST